MMRRLSSMALAWPRPPGRRERLPAHAPLRTVRESFPSYGSSLSSPVLWCEVGRQSGQRKYCPVRLGRAGLSTNAPREAAALPKILRVNWVVGVGIPSHLDVAVNSSADRLIEFKCRVLSVCRSEADSELPV